MISGVFFLSEDLGIYAFEFLFCGFIVFDFWFLRIFVCIKSDEWYGSYREFWRERVFLVDRGEYKWIVIGVFVSLVCWRNRREDNVGAEVGRRVVGSVRIF